MEMRVKETDWAQKYRPASLEELILPAAIKKSLVAMRDSQQGPSLLLHGPAGTGKTTVGMLINAGNTVKINCSTHNGIDMVRHLDQSARCGSLVDGVRVILLDEADNLRAAEQAGLQSVVEDLSFTNVFVLTANRPSKLNGPLHSRLHPIDFGLMQGDQALRSAMTERAIQIIQAEEIDVDLSIIRAIVNKHFPDMRQVLKTLQFEIGMAVMHSAS